MDNEVGERIAKAIDGLTAAVTEQTEVVASQLEKIVSGIDALETQLTQISMEIEGAKPKPETYLMPKR